jgi:excisionase family DNA binding protein
MAGVKYELAADDLDRFAGIAEAAARLGISRSTAYRLISDNEFPVPVLTVAGKQKVSLRLLVEHINGPTSRRAGLLGQCHRQESRTR